MILSETYPYGYYFDLSWVHSPNGLVTKGIDEKLDDGKPFTGLLKSSIHGNCTTGTGINSIYDVTPGSDQGSCTPQLIIEK